MMNEKRWHQMDAGEALQQLGSSAAQGLSTAEAERRLADQGASELQAAPPISRWAILAEQFKNVLIIILLIAVALSAFLGHTIEALAIAVIVLFAALLGFFQEYRAERALEALRHLAAPLRPCLERGKSLPCRRARWLSGTLSSCAWETRFRRMDG